MNRDTPDAPPLHSPGRRSHMTHDVVTLARQLVSIPSPTGEEGEVASFLADVLTDTGWQVHRQQVTPGRDNLYATRAVPVVVLSTHLDTVPGGPAPREDSTTMWGRGIVDAKGIAAAMVTAAETLAGEGDDRVGLLFLVGEEDGSDGALAAADLAGKGRFLINGEPTENRLAIGQKGTLRVTLTASGSAAHSGYPDLGRSAIDPLLDALHAIRSLALPVDPVLGPSTLNIGRLTGGVAPNVIPPHASAELLIRTVGPSTPIRDAITAIADPLGVIAGFPLEIPPVRSTPLDGWDTTVVSYTSDWPLLSAWGTGYQLGPGSIRVAHTDDERITKAELRDGVSAYVRLLHTLLGTPLP